MPTNNYYNHGSVPQNGTPGDAQEVGAEFDSVQAGFAKLPALSGNGGKVVKINSGGTAMEAQAADALIAETIHAATSKATPVDADELSLADSAASFGLKKLTWANLKAALGSIFAALAGNASQVFSVAAATAAAHAVRADQIQNGSLNSFTTAGTSTAYTLTPAPAISAVTAGQLFHGIFHTANGNNPTIAINGLASPPNLVRQNLDGTYSNLAANAFPAGWQSDMKVVSASQVLVLKLPPRRFSGAFTRDTSLASGTQAVTGVGFKPTKVTFQAAVLSTLRGSTGCGIAGGGMCQLHQSTGNLYVSANAIYLENGGNDYYGVPSSMDADGFTFSWTKLNTPTGTATIYFIAEE